MTFALVAAVNGYHLSALRFGSVRAIRRMATKAPRMDLTLEETGEFGTTDYVMTFKKGDDTISPWHDMPLEAGDGLYNMLTEIPKMTLKKMEVAMVSTTCSPRSRR